MSRILYLVADRGITSDKANGAVATFRAVVRTLPRLGHDVLVLSSLVPPSDAAVGFEPIRTAGFVQRLVADTDHGRADEGALEARRIVSAAAHLVHNAAVEDTLRRVVPRFRPEAVIERYAPFGIAGVYTAHALGVRHLLNVHAPLAWEGRTYRSQRLAEAADLLEARVLAAATRIAVTSAEMATILVGMGVDDQRIVVVPSGVDATVFSPTGPDHRDRLPPGTIVVGFSGSLKRWHGIDLLLDAFERLAAADPSLHLLIVGDGPMRHHVRRAAERWPGRVTSTGALPPEDVPAWVRTMDVAVSPYPALERFYHSPLKTMEYMAAGRATVSAAIGQLCGLVDDHRTGVLVPPGDAAALAAAIRGLAEDAGLRERLGAAATDVAARRYRWSDRVAELVGAALDQPVPRSAEGSRQWAAPPARRR